MKKVRRSADIKVKLSNQMIRRKNTPERIEKPKNPMINSKLYKSLTGGDSLCDYRLDLMKLG